MAKSKTPARPPIHCLVYGFSGAKKTTLAASFTTPIRVNMFDAMGMESPFMRRGDEWEDGESPTTGVPMRRIYLKGDLIVEILFFHDEDPEKNPDAWPLFREEQRAFEPTKWGTWVGDSITSMVDAAEFEQAKLNKEFNHFKRMGPVTDQLSLHLKTRIARYTCNTVLIAHIERKFITQPGMAKGAPSTRVDKRMESAFEEEDGSTVMLRGLSAPGRLSRNDGLVTQFSEVYRAYIGVDEKGNKQWKLQTEGMPGDEWVAKTQIGAPDGCEPDYENLWANYDRGQ